MEEYILLSELEEHTKNEFVNKILPDGNLKMQPSGRLKQFSTPCDIFYSDDIIQSTKSGSLPYYYYYPRIVENPIQFWGKEYMVPKRMDFEEYRVDDPPPWNIKYINPIHPNRFGSCINKIKPKIDDAIDEGKKIWHFYVVDPKREKYHKQDDRFTKLNMVTEFEIKVDKKCVDKLIKTTEKHTKTTTKPRHGMIQKPSIAILPQMSSISERVETINEQMNNYKKK